MIIEYLVNKALLDEKLILVEKKPGHFFLQAKFAGARITLASVAVAVEPVTRTDSDNEPTVVSLPRISE